MPRSILLRAKRDNAVQSGETTLRLGFWVNCFTCWKYRYYCSLCNLCTSLCTLRALQLTNEIKQTRSSDHRLILLNKVSTASALSKIAVLFPLFISTWRIFSIRLVPARLVTLHLPNWKLQCELKLRIVEQYETTPTTRSLSDCKSVANSLQLESCFRLFNEWYTISEIFLQFLVPIASIADVICVDG